MDSPYASLGAKLFSNSAVPKVGSRQGNHKVGDISPLSVYNDPFSNQNSIRQAAKSHVP